MYTFLLMYKRQNKRLVMKVKLRNFFTGSPLDLELSRSQETSDPPKDLYQIKQLAKDLLEAIQGLLKNRLLRIIR